MLGTPTMGTVTARWATTADIDELVRLRQVMFDAMDEKLTAADREAVATALRDGLPTGEFFAAVVDGDGFLASSGVGMVVRHLPGPGNPSGRRGYIQSMATDERCRRRGCARAVLAALLGRFTELGVVMVDLHATPYGLPLYQSMGFVLEDEPGLSWTAS